jgi:hypothetical protein
VLRGELPDLPPAHILPMVGMVDVDRIVSELSHESLAAAPTAEATKCNILPMIRK